MTAYVQAHIIWLHAIRTKNWTIERIAYANMQRAFAILLNDAFTVNV